MSRRTTASLVVLLLLASVAPAAHAASLNSFFAGPDLFVRAWSFLERLLVPASSAAGPGESPEGARAIWANGGMCIDPNGRPAAAGCAGSQVIWSEGGACIDSDSQQGAASCADLSGQEH